MSAYDAKIEKSPFRSEMSFWTWMFGTAVSAMGLIGFIQGIFEIKLIPDYAQGLAAYQAVVHSIWNVLFPPAVHFIEWAASCFNVSLQIPVPEWWKDLATLSTISMAAALRSRAIAFPEELQASLPSKLLTILTWLLFIGMTGLGVALMVAIFGKNEDPQQRKFMRAYRISLLAIAITASIFFVTNAYPI